MSVRQPEWHDLGGLTAVTAHLVDGLLVGLTLGLSGGRVHFAAVADDDTLVVHDLGWRDLETTTAGSLPIAGLPTDVTYQPLWLAFLGTPVRWGRAMVNHRGYVDGYQLEFATGGGAVGRCIDLVVVASELKLGLGSFTVDGST